MCTSLACCAGCCVYKGCSECVGATLKQQVRLSYLIFDGIFVALTLVTIYGISRALISTSFISDMLRDHLDCPADQDLQCFSISVVYRISLALVVLHVFVLFWLIWRNGCSKRFNEGVWFFKLLLVVGSFVLFFFIKNTVFSNYAKAIMVLSLVFLLFQIIMMIDLSYIMSQRWVAKYDAGKSAYAIPLFGCSIILYAAAAYGIIRSYIWFSGCGIGAAAVSITLGLIVLSTLLVFLRTNPNGSILTTGVVAAYATFLTWSGLSNMDKTCNPLLNKDSTTIAHLVFGLIVIAIALLYVSIGKSSKSSGFVAPKGVDIAKGVLEDEDKSGEAYKDEERGKAVENKNKENGSQDSDLKAYKNNNYIYFHIIMIFASFYMAMILTNWGQPVIDGETFLQFKASNLSMWIKLGASWAALGIYNWTLLAPKIFPNREFS